MNALPESAAIYREIGARIGAARRRANLTQEDLAGQIGLTRTSIVNIEKGRQKLLVHTLLSICKLLRVPATDLIRGVEQEEPASSGIDLASIPASLHDFIRSGARLAETAESKS